MTEQSLSAIIIDNSNDKQLPTIIKDDLSISHLKVYKNTLEALNVIRQNNNIDLVYINYETTLDKTFPFVKKAKEIENCKNTKFFLLANHSNKNFLREAANSGVSAFILKPYKNEKLIEKTNKLLPATEKRIDKRVNLLESVSARLRFKGKEITGGIEDISSGGCLICTPKLTGMGIAVYDIVTIRVEFENEKLGVNAEVVRMEKDDTQDFKAVNTAFKFTKPNEENALQFAKLWAFILKERESV